MSRVVHFEITADDAERAVKFYEQVFGWSTQRRGGPQQTYWLMNTGPTDEPGIHGGIMRRAEGFPPTVNSIAVQSVDEFVKKIVGAGGKISRPKMAIPGVGYQAYCFDTEGNLFGIHQSDPSAK